MNEHSEHLHPEPFAPAPDAERPRPELLARLEDEEFVEPYAPAAPRLSPRRARRAPGYSKTFTETAARMGIDLPDPVEP